MAKKTKAQIAKELRAEAVGTFSTLITSAFGLVAAFAWNDVVRRTIDRYITAGQGLKSSLIYAVIVTILAVIVSFQLGKLAGRYKIESEDEDKK